MAAVMSFSIDLANEQTGRMLEAANAATDDGAAKVRLTCPINPGGRRARQQSASNNGSLLGGNGALSWHIREGHADGLDLSGLQLVMSIRYFDRVQPSTRWEVVLYVDHAADDDQKTAVTDIFLGRAGGTVARLYGPAIGEVHVVRSARITLEHAVPRKRIGVVGYLTVEAEGDASAPGAASRVSTTPAPSSMVTGCGEPTRPCMGGSRTPTRRLRHGL
jgi:Protein of unknown function (DUF1326)